MNWLARLKKIETAPEHDATEPTKPGFVGFVAPYMAPMPKTQGVPQAANAPSPDPDRWCWPDSDAMNSGEIDTFTARLHHFTRRGMTEPDAEELADKLMKRHRDSDDRGLCLECVHLSGYAGSWGCRNGQRAGLASQGQAVPLSAALVHQLKRCDGFKEVQARPRNTQNPWK